MFDRPVIDGPDNDFSMINILSNTSPTESLPNVSDMDGIEGLDFLNLLESTLGLDINDYLGDVTQESDLIDFQNMVAGALENFDGLL
jgi:hypothetical protein